MSSHLAMLQRRLRRLCLHPRKHWFFSSCIESTRHHHKRPFSSSSTTTTTIPNPSIPCLWFPRFNRLEPIPDSDDGANLPRVIYSVNDGKIKHPQVPDSYHLQRATDMKIIEVKDNLGQPGQELLGLNSRLCLGSSHEWLVYENPATKLLYLYNPFADPSTTLPYVPLGTSSSFGEKASTFSIPSFEEDELSSISTDRPVAYFGHLFGEPLPYRFRNRFADRRFSYSPASKYPYVDKRFAFSSSTVPSPASATPPEDKQANPSGESCTILSIIRDKLYFCKPGEIPWTPLSIANEEQDYIEVMYFAGDRRFYALTYSECVEAIDLDNASAPKIYLVNNSLPTDDDWKTYGHCRNNYLVESSGELLMVERYTFRQKGL